MEPSTLSPAVTSLLGMGLPGIIIVALAFTVRHLFGLLQTAQAALLQQSVDNRTAIERNTTAFSALTEALNRTKG